MKLKIRNIASYNVSSIKSLVNTTFGALPEVEQSYIKQCDDTSTAEGYSVIYNDYYSEWQTRDDRKQELCERANPYKARTPQSFGFIQAQEDLKRNELTYRGSCPIERYELQYEVDAVDLALMVRFAHNLALTYRTAEFSLKD
jgi:hypothetical protein